MPTDSEDRITPSELQRLEEIAQRHGIGSDAAIVLLSALQSGGGKMAQFNHPELGGMGQWSNGMIMIGDFSNNDLKARVLALCNDLAQFKTEFKPMAEHSQSSTSNWWPANLGTPSSVGAQNEMRYAYFPATHRLAIKENDQISIFDTGDHAIHGVSQQQGLKNTLIFESQHGTVQAKDLTLVERI